MSTNEGLSALPDRTRPRTSFLMARKFYGADNPSGGTIARLRFTYSFINFRNRSYDPLSALVHIVSGHGRYPTALCASEPSWVCRLPLCHPTDERS